MALETISEVEVVTQSLDKMREFDRSRYESAVNSIQTSQAVLEAASKIIDISTQTVGGSTQEYNELLGALHQHFQNKEQGYKDLALLADEKLISDCGPKSSLQQANRN